MTSCARVGLTFATPTSIPVQLGKWIALHEAFGTRKRESHSHPKDPNGAEPQLCMCKPVQLQLLEGGALRVVFSVSNDCIQEMKQWMEGDTSSCVLACTRMPAFAYESRGTGSVPHPVPDCAWCLAEIVLTVLDKFATVGARDPGTLQDLFGHYFGTHAYLRPGWEDNYGPLPNSRTLNEVQFASILHLSDQYRAKFGSDAIPCAFAYRYGQGRTDALHRVRSLAALAPAPASAPASAPPPDPRPAPRLSLLEAQVRKLEAQATPPAAAAAPSGCVDACPPQSEKGCVQLMQRGAIQLVSGNKQAPTRGPPVAMECMAFTCATVEDVPVMVAKLMAVCSSDTVGYGQVRPCELQLLLDKGEVLIARVVMHVHRLVADQVRAVPDWARPYPAKDERPGLIQLKARLPDWNEGGVAAPLAHSVHLAALLHAWFERCIKKTTKRCRKFLDLVTGHDGPENLMLTEEQQHILLELSEEYLVLHRNGWRNEPKDPAERHDSPTSVEEAEFPKLGDSPAQDAFGRTTYLQSMFAITKPATHSTDFEKLWTVAYLGPRHRDRIWLTGQKPNRYNGGVIPAVSACIPRPDHARISCQHSTRHAIGTW